MTAYKVGDRIISSEGAIHAEYSLITQVGTYAFKIPVTISYEIAAIFTTQEFTAITLIEKAFIVKKGDLILVHAGSGGGGGVGSLLVQLNHQKGATVIGITSTEEKATFIKTLGAGYLINHKTKSILEHVLEITGGKGVDAALIA